MLFLIVLLYMLFASTFTIGKAVLAYTSPIFFIAIRMLVSGFILLIYQYFFNYAQWHYKWKDRTLLLKIAIFQYYGAFVLEFLALQWLTSSKACLIYNLAPFVTALLSFILFHEQLNCKKIIGLIIGFLGFIPILGMQVLHEQGASSLIHISFPELLQLGSVICASYGWIIVQQAKEKKYNILMINGLTMTIAGIAALCTSLLVEGKPFIIPPANCVSLSLSWLCAIFEPYGLYWAGVTVFVFYTFLLILIANIIGFNLYGYLLSFYSTTFLSFAGFITPLFAALFGWLFLGETIGWSFIVTMMVVFAGLLLFYQEELKHNKKSRH